MWPLLEHPGPNPTSKPLLPGHQLVFPLQAQICLPAPQILPQKSQRLGLPTETDPRLSTGEVWHWIPNKTLQNPRAHFAKPGSWEHGQVVLPGAGLARPLSAVFPQQRPDLDAHPFCVLCLPSCVFPSNNLQRKNLTLLAQMRQFTGTSSLNGELERKHFSKGICRGMVPLKYPPDLHY